MTTADLTGITLGTDLRDRRITADYVAEALREAIHCGILEEGTVLNQAAIAAHFGVSRVPVREAMRELHAEGLIESRAHRLAIVRGLDLERIVEIYSLRALLEGWLMEQATPGLDADRLAAARELNEEMRDVADHLRWLELNGKFHRMLYEPSGAITTLELLDGLRVRAERYTRQWSGGAGVHRPGEASDEHAEILALAEAGDAAAARAAVELHIQHTRDRVIAYGREQAAAAETTAPEPA